MSTCSTATSAHRVRGRESRRRRPPASSESDGRGHLDLVLERRLLDLERDWDAYKTVRRPGALRHRHRRSRSASATPSSAVTVAAPEGLLLLRRSPRRLVWSLQQPTSSTETDGADGAAKIVGQQGDGGAPAAGAYDDEDASSVCSRCESWCPCQRAVLCQRGYSGASSSCSCTGSSCTTAPSSSSPVGGSNGGRARKMGEGKWVWVSGSRVLWISAIALLVVVGFVATVILEVGVHGGDEDDYLVPT